MFDKITIRATVSDAEAAHLSQLHRLHVWRNDAGTKVEYRHSEYSKLTGIVVNIIRNKVTIKTSLHKFWNDRTRGLLRNDDEFTVSEAKSAFEMLLFENGLVAAKTRIIQFEVGLNLKVTYDPLTFIKLVRFVSFRDKVMFIDANYRIDRQKTTEKHDDIRKYYKIYDKSWEMREKRRIVPIEELMNPVYTLRIETVYRRHNERTDTFFTDANINRLTTRFYADWSSLFFAREVDAHKGARKSEIERARIIINSGADQYMNSVKADYDRGLITAKQFRTIREFVRDFEKNKQYFRTVVSKQEEQYKRLLYHAYNTCRV